MKPGGMAVLQNSRHQCGAGRVKHAFFGRMAQDPVVRSQQRSRKKFSRILDAGFRLLLIQSANRFQRQLGGDFPFRVAAHSVGQHQQA